MLFCADIQKLRESSQVQAELWVSRLQKYQNSDPSQVGSTPMIWYIWVHEHRLSSCCDVDVYRVLTHSPENWETSRENFSWIAILGNFRPTTALCYATIHNGKHIWLVVSTPLKNMKVSWDDYSQYGKIKNIPNHQSDIYIYIYWPCMANNRYTNMSWILTNLRSRWIIKTLQSVPSAHIGRVRGLCSRYLKGNAMCKWPVGTRATRKRYKVVPQWTKSLKWLVQSYFTRNYGDEIAI